MLTGVCIFTTVILQIQSLSDIFQNMWSFYETMAIQTKKLGYHKVNELQTTEQQSWN